MDNEALYHFVRQSPECFAHIVDLGTVEPILERLVRDGMSPKDLLVRTLRSPLLARLFQKLLDLHSEQPMRRLLLDEIMRLIARRRFEDEFLEVSDILSAHFRRIEDFDRLLGEHRAAFGEWVCERGGRMDADAYDAYWTQRVGERIIRKDFRRAWDELRRASSGFLAAPCPENANPFKWNNAPDLRILKAGNGCTDRLCLLLCERMVMAGQLGKEALCDPRANLQKHFRKVRSERRAAKRARLVETLLRNDREGGTPTAAS